MGWWPSKICVLLNLVILLGYALIDAVIAGQILSGVADGRMPIAVGIVIVSLLSWIITTFGIRLFHIWER